MAKLSINERELDSLKDKVVIITGGSSGIGLATAQLLHSKGAKIIQGDLTPPPEDVPKAIAYKQTDVTSWQSLRSLFAEAKSRYGRIDHVFANAGVGGAKNYLIDDFDEKGELQEPNHIAVHVMVTGLMNTVKLAIHHMKDQAEGGSIVLTASASSFQRLQVPDYTACKHAVLGLMRSLSDSLYPSLPIRINSITPSWTATGMVREEWIKGAGVPSQPASAVALSVGILMADDRRNQQTLYSEQGEYWEIEAELLEAVRRIIPRETTEDEYLSRIMAWRQANPR